MWNLINLPLKYTLIFVAFSLILLSCQDSQQNLSEDLKQAAAYQKEGLEINHRLETYFKNNEAINDLAYLKEKQDQLRNSMIEIPEIPHDHRYCNGKHQNIKVQVSDAEMLSIQKEWRDSMYSLFQKIEKE